MKHVNCFRLLIYPGVLAQAKNGHQVFWEEKFHAANGKAQACTQGALLFFLLCYWGGDFSYFPASQCVHTMFPNFVMFSPTSSPYHLTFIPYAFGKGFLLSVIYMGQRGGTIYFKIEPFVLESLHSFIFFSDGPIKLACRQNKIK